SSIENIIQFIYGDDMIDPGKSDHGEAINIDAIFLKIKNLETLKIKQKEYLKKLEEKLKKENKLTKQKKKIFDTIRNHKIQFYFDTETDTNRDSSKIEINRNSIESYSID
ncbi:MAG: hypothetical protein ACTSRZ_17660, partial [Promethearchaeota archaeon]